MSANVNKHLALLGKQATDKVTGFTGTITSVCFDLYGCTQALINPRLDKDGKFGDAAWFDPVRLSVDDTPVASPRTGF